MKLYAILSIIGVLLGVGMQYSSHLQGQWGQNFITYMANDLACWAVIAIVIATYAKNSFHSGLGNFIFMMSMVISYYSLNLESAKWNIYWIVLGLLMFLIGIFIYWYQTKGLVLIVLEAGMLIFFIMDVVTFISKVTNNKMVVYDNAGNCVFMQETLFSLGNYVLIMLISLFGIIFAAWKYWNAHKLA